MFLNFEDMDIDFRSISFVEEKNFCHCEHQVKYCPGRY